jgi:hypothetical protein
VAVQTTQLIPVTGIDFTKASTNPALFFNLSLTSLGFGMVAHGLVRNRRKDE